MRLMARKWTFYLLLAFLGFNGLLIFKVLLLDQSIIVAVDTILFITIVASSLFYEKYVEGPKSLLESLETLKQFHSIKNTGEINKDLKFDVVELAQYKDDVLATKKGVVNTMIVKQGDTPILAKDDTFFRSNPASIKFYTTDFIYQPVVYKSRADFEREARMLPIRTDTQKPSKTHTEIKIKQKEERQQEPSTKPIYV